MKIDLAEAMAVEDSLWQREASLDLEEVSIAQGRFPVIKKTPVQITARHSKKGRLQLKVSAEVLVEIPCDRCLTPVSSAISIDAERQLDLGESDQPVYIEGTVLDVDGLIFHELLLHWPAKILCREDCKGLCPVCGADLNQGECGCDRHVLDPRMAAIQDIFNKFQS